VKTCLILIFICLPLSLNLPLRQESRSPAQSKGIFRSCLDFFEPYLYPDLKNFRENLFVLKERSWQWPNENNQEVLRLQKLIERKNESYLQDPEYVKDLYRLVKKIPNEFKGQSIDYSNSDFMLLLNIKSYADYDEISIPLIQLRGLQNAQTSAQLNTNFLKMISLLQNAILLTQKQSNKSASRTVRFKLQHVINFYLAQMLTNLGFVSEHFGRTLDAAEIESVLGAFKRESFDPFSLPTKLKDGENCFTFSLDFLVTIH
jgi:hypothetical protein